MYKYLFGPVPSRRLGMSLGVDLVPRKVCSMDCVYCEVGKTSSLTIERKEYIPQEKIQSELITYFRSNPDPDYITFSGSGEPTLNSRIGSIIRFLRKLRPEIPAAVLTNGTLFSDRMVRHALKEAQVVLPSLDAATEETFRKINCPHSSLTVRKHIQGLVDFRKEFEGEIWLEVFILPTYNDSQDELAKLKMAIDKIRPDRVQLNTLDRPGCVEGLRSATKQELQRAGQLLGPQNAEIIATPETRRHIPSFQGNIASCILETISRRPCTLDDIVNLTGLHVNEINKYMKVLESENKIVSIKQQRGIFYKAIPPGNNRP